MKELSIACASGVSRIIAGAGALALCDSVQAARKILVVDEKVQDLYGKLLPSWPYIVIKGGEETKTLETVEALYSEFLRLELDRSAFVFAAGGGTVCDTVAFAANTYLRGVRVGLVPTTLLAQVDASIGGKNGVNFGGFKNQIGTIRQPELVICDPLFLKSVPEREIRSGYAEVVKAGAIADAELIEYLESHTQAALKLEPEAVERALHAALMVKARIVEADETERGERMKLNFGHTIGHAVESTEHIPHGEAVSIGMIADLKLSRKLLGLTAGEAARVQHLLESFGLPVEARAEKDRLIAATLHDKKRRGAEVRMALLRSIGKSEVVSVKFSELEEAINDLCLHR